MQSGPLLGARSTGYSHCCQSKVTEQPLPPGPCPCPEHLRSVSTLAAIKGLLQSASITSILFLFIYFPLFLAAAVSAEPSVFLLVFLRSVLEPLRLAKSLLSLETIKKKKVSWRAAEENKAKKFLPAVHLCAQCMDPVCEWTGIHIT